MNNTKHETKQNASYTPGTWVANGAHVQAIYTPTDGGRPFYHTIARTDQPLVFAEQQGANALLIAAAPRMLSALQGVIDSLSQNKTFPADIENAKRLARDAIAETKGLTA